jgi:adenylate kinase family enzyme
MEVINESIKNRDDNGRLVKSILVAGEAIPDEIVLKMIGEKIQSAEVAHQGISDV